jgi:hypothetical protein
MEKYAPRLIGDLHLLLVTSGDSRDKLEDNTDILSPLPNAPTAVLVTLVTAMACCYIPMVARLQSASDVVSSPRQ